MELVVGPIAGLYAGTGEPAQVAEGVAKWLEDLNRAIRNHLPEPLAWRDTGVTSRLDLPAPAYAALRLLTAYVQRPEMAWPDEVPPSVDSDRAWQEISADNFARCHFPQVVIPQLWLPGDFAFTMVHAMPDGEEVVLGSLDGLTMQLRQLNQQTLQLGKDAVMARVGKPMVGDEFVANATYGLAVFLHAASEAGGLGLPVRLLLTG